MDVSFRNRHDFLVTCFGAYVDLSGERAVYAIVMSLCDCTLADALHKAGGYCHEHLCFYFFSRCTDVTVDTESKLVWLHQVRPSVLELCAELRSTDISGALSGVFTWCELHNPMSLIPISVKITISEHYCVCSCAAQVACALRFLHAGHLVHLDVKPTNVLLHKVHYQMC